MAYTAGNLHLRAGAPGDLSYTYDAGSDTLATVLTAGYFNNTDDDLVLTVDDLIFVQATDGNCWARVSAVSSGSVTLQFAGGNLPIQTAATGTAAERASLLIGFYEIGSATAAGDCTASRYVLPTPYPGAEVQVRRTDSGTLGRSFDAGGSATGETGITFDGVGNRRITLTREGEGFHVVGSSTTRWRIVGLDFQATDTSSLTAGASAVLAGT
jgi:hypothetical protein